MSEVVSAMQTQYERGARMFRDGKLSPPKPADDATGFEPESLLWIGYRVAMGVDWLKRCDVARQLDMPEPELREPR